MPVAADEFRRQFSDGEGGRERRVTEHTDGRSMNERSARKSITGVRANQGIKQRQSKTTEERKVSTREQDPP